MKIVLVGAEFEENLAIRYLRGALENSGHKVQQIIFNEREDLERAAKELASSGASIAGFSMVFTWRAREFADLAVRSRQLGFKGHLIAGGHFAAFNAEQMLKDISAFDSVGCGEGEGIMCQLAENLQNLQVVKGLVWRNSEGAIVRNAPADKPELDTLAFPHHSELADTFLGIKAANMIGSRGCTHACNFCSIAAWHRLCGGKRFRMRSVANIADEMAQLYEQGIRIYDFHDDNFILCDKTQTMNRMSELKAELKNRGVEKIAFAIKSRPDSVDEELFQFLKDMGLFRVFIGIEAGTADALSNLGRGQTASDNQNALAIVNKLNLHACFNLLLFNPESTLEDIEANVSFLANHPHNPMNFSRTEIYAGTPLEIKLAHQNRLLGDYWGYDYRITDPRAERLFQIVYPAFKERNYGYDCLHHTSMRLDFEYQILSRFYGPNRSLHRKIKEFIVAVNLNTCHYLQEFIAVTREKTQPPQTIINLGQQIHEDNLRLLEAGNSLLYEIRTSAIHKCNSSKRGWVKKAVAAGLIAGVSMTAAAGCKPPGGGTQIFEYSAYPSLTMMPDLGN